MRYPYPSTAIIKAPRVSTIRSHIVSVKPEGSPNISRIAGIITSENYKELLKEVKNMSTRSVETIVARHSPRENYFDTIKPIFLRTNSSEGKSPEMGKRESGKIFTAGAGSRKRDFSSAGNTSKYSINGAVNLLVRSSLVDGKKRISYNSKRWQSIILYF